MNAHSIFVKWTTIMPYQSDLERCCEEIDAARRAVAKAQEQRQRGGSVDAENVANRRLADAHAAYRECSGGNIPDRR
jgi:hypothetical protein